MDNLIGAYNKMPIIQMDYTNATATVTAKEAYTLGDMLAPAHINAVTAAAAGMLVITNTTLNTFTGGTSLDHTNQVAVLATPVTTTDAVYDAYEAFLAIDGSLRVSCQPPPADAVHLCKRCGEMYYWVPVEYKREFLRLALATTAQRGAAAAPPDAFYSTNFIQVVNREFVSGDVSAGTANYFLSLKMDKKIPIDSGYADVSSNSKGSPQGGPSPGGNPGKADGKDKGKSAANGLPAPAAVGQGANSADDPTQTGGAKVAAQSGMLLILPPDETKSQSGRTPTTDVVRVLFQGAYPPSGFKTPDDLIQAIVSQPLAAKIYLHRHRPQLGTPSDTNSRIEFYLQQIQQGQIRGAIGP